MNPLPEPWPFYSRAGIHVEVYDLLTQQGFAEAQPDTEFLIEQATETGGPVLELASGTGRVAWPLAAAGHRVVGLELSDAMRAAAAAKADEHPPEVRERIRFVAGDMRGFDLGERFGLVYATFRSFQALLSPDDQRACLRCAHRHLRPGGRLVLDLFDPRLEWLAPGAAGGATNVMLRHPASGRLVTVRSEGRVNDPVAQILEEVWTFTDTGPDGTILRRERERLRARWSYRYEMRYLLEICGFASITEYSDFHAAPPAYGQEQVWVAHRGA